MSETSPFYDSLPATISDEDWATLERTYSSMALSHHALKEAKREAKRLIEAARRQLEQDAHEMAKVRERIFCVP